MSKGLRSEGEKLVVAISEFPLTAMSLSFLRLWPGRVMMLEVVLTTAASWLTWDRRADEKLPRLQLSAEAESVASESNAVVEPRLLSATLG